jgi:uncharacterized damage-inducible protein DinB
MSELTFILAELKDIHQGNAWHGPSLRESLAGLTAEQAAARPIRKAHSIWEIVSHIAGWENVFRRRLEGEGRASEPEAGDFPPVKDSSEEAWIQTLDYLEGEHQKLLKVISSLSEEILETNVAQRDYSMRFLLHGIVRHHVYHAGQISLLRIDLAVADIDDKPIPKYYRRRLI